MNALTVSNLKLSIRGSVILRGVDLDIKANLVTALIGRNGVGKSTTLRSIMGLYPSEGDVELEGRNICKLPTYKRVQQGLAFVPEDREIFSQLTVSENLALAELDKDANYDLVYSLFPELKIRAHQRAGTLSGGQQQMVAIARVLLNKSKLILIDEPTKGLAPKLVTEVAEAITRLSTVVTLLLVEQNLALVKRVAKEITVMDQCKSIFHGDVKNLDNEDFVQKHLSLGVKH